jgi:phage gp36-like protein
MSQYATALELGLYGMTPAALGTFSDDQKNAALIAASDHADSYLQQRFRLPLTSTATALKMHVARMAAWILMSSRGFKPGAADAETLHAAYRDAEKWLKDVAEGLVTPSGLTDADATDEPGSTDAGQGAPFVVSVSSREAVVTRYLEFFGHDTPAAVGVVGSPRVRGW